MSKVAVFRQPSVLIETPDSVTKKDTTGKGRKIQRLIQLLLVPFRFFKLHFSVAMM